MLVLFATLARDIGFAADAGDDAEPAPAVRRWLGRQEWRRDTEGPVVSLGEAGRFDDQHLFAPCVMRDEGRFLLWYCGSRGEVARRVFGLGLATSEDGRQFAKHADNPVFQFGDGKHSVLTPTLLRETDGRPIREGGRLRMWFAATHFEGGSGLHTLHETTSRDGVHWTPPSEAQLKHVYAPTIVKEKGVYKLWYTDVSSEPWNFRHATSRDGREWEVHPEPVLQVDQDWERGRLFYPTVLKIDDVYVMWYGSYWSAQSNNAQSNKAQSNKTAIGVAASSDGVHWHKSPHNPVLRPDPARPWESHYTTSQSVIRQRDGGFRIWYASRKRPPFVNKYFAINTAVWDGP
ncbi:MAG: hypothetical protein RIC55_22465 [Pirellulaceae bacterium]